jgi:hypothetical protein
MDYAHGLTGVESARLEHALHVLIGLWSLGALSDAASVQAALELFPETEILRLISITDGQLDPCFVGTSVRRDSVLEAAVQGCSLASMQVYWKFLRPEHLVAAFVVAVRCGPQAGLVPSMKPPGKPAE